MSLTSISVGARIMQLASGEVVCVLDQSMGIDSAADVPTPLLESMRADFRFEGADAVLLLEAVKRLIRGELPLVVRGVPTPIRDEPAKRSVVLPKEPGDSSDLNSSNVGFVIHEAVQ